MALILTEDNTRAMTNEQLLISALTEYSDPDNWNEYEKDFAGRIGTVNISPWASRDRGHHARMALAIIAARAKAGA